LIDDGYEPIEECTVKDVGWMKVSFFDTGLNGFVKHGRAWYFGNSVLLIFAMVSREDTFPDVPYLI
jgi:hypothetical protein